MSLLIPSGHRKREAIELLRRNIEVFMGPRIPVKQRHMIELHIEQMLCSPNDIDVQAKMEIDGPQIGLALIFSQVVEKKG